MSDRKAEAIVVGGGPTGLTAAIALAAGGIDTVLVGKRPATADNRTTALLAGSVAALTTLGVWQHCTAQAAPLKHLRIVDNTSRLWRAPEVTFAAEEIGLTAFGYNIENHHLVAAQEHRAQTLSNLCMIEDEVSGVTPAECFVTVAHKNGAPLQAPLVIGADGRRSLCRAIAGIVMEEHRYPQVALTLSLSHSRPHGNTSTEFHTRNGPFTLVPLPGKRSSLVWVCDLAEADALATIDDDELSAAVEGASHSILGKIAVESGRGRFPLTIASATILAARRIVLVGEAAHVIPPIGAQGLNLGLRDAASIGELAVTAKRRGLDIGSVNLLAHYGKMRRADIDSRRRAVDWLNRTLLTDFLPVQGARGLGLYMLDRIGPLRRALMREGVMPVAAQTRLMRGEAL